MSLPDFVSEVLTYVGTGTDGNWDTNNYDPAPVRFNRDERVRLDTDARVKGVDLTDGNVISADSTPTRSNRAYGTDYDHDARVGVGVRIEGLHEDAGGQLTGDDDFNLLIGEAKRAIMVERTYPTDHPMRHLLIEEESSETPSENREDWHHFRYDFTVWFEGREELP